MCDSSASVVLIRRMGFVPVHLPESCPGGCWALTAGLGRGVESPRGRERPEAPVPLTRAGRCEKEPARPGSLPCFLNGNRASSPDSIFSLILFSNNQRVFSLKKKMRFALTCPLETPRPSLSGSPP